jgi:fructokinase
MKRYFGGIEGGGTKFRLIVANSPHDVLAEEQFITTSPTETLKKCVKFFRFIDQLNDCQIEAVGVGSFGPLDLDPNSPRYGFLTRTPKPAWSNTNILGFLQDRFDCPIFLDTDVNCAALGEHAWGAAQGLNDFVYITVGTGIGGGVFCNGRPLHGLVHSELGHMLIPHDKVHDPFAGICPFHGDCLEGLASGLAISKRWGQSAGSLPQNHPAWDLEAGYLGLAITNIILTLSPYRVVLGGGVMNQNSMLVKIRAHVNTNLKGYVQPLRSKTSINSLIVLPGLGEKAGVLGAVSLARNLFQKKK